MKIVKNDKLAKLRIAEARVRAAKKQLAEAKRNLREDVNGFTFKDLFGQTFDEVLKDACQVLEDIVEAGYDGDYDEMFQDDADRKIVSEVFETEKTADAVSEVTVALWEKIESLEDFNKLRKSLGLEEIEEDEED